MTTLLEYALGDEIIFIGGKGGVGKTTMAAALAVQLANSGKKTLIISTDPAHSLGDVFEVNLSGEAKRLTSNLSALELNPETIINAHFKTVEDTMRAYANSDMMPALRKHLALAKQSPGAEEAAMLEAICRYLVNFRELGFERLIFDTAPTGHTLRLMILPEMMRAWTDGMLAQSRKQQNMREAMSSLLSDADSSQDPQRRQDQRLAQASAALNARRSLFEQARKILHKGGTAAVFLVMTPEMLPLAETLRTHQQMHQFHLPLKGIIINQVMPKDQSEAFWQQRANRQQRVITEIKRQLSDVPHFYFPLRADDIRGVAVLSDFIADS